MNPPTIDAAPFGFFVFRTPLLPRAVVAKLGEGLCAQAATPVELEAALASDRARIEAQLREHLGDPVVREALWVASPSLDEAITAWLADPCSPRGKGVPVVVLRYLVRMASRTTPFGLFSGCSLGTIGTQTRLTVAPRQAYARRTRLDMNYLSAVAEGLRRDPTIREALRWRPSDALYRSGQRFRYAEGRIDPNTRAKTYELVEIAHSEHLEVALQRAEHGARISELCDAVVQAAKSIDDAEARAFVEELIDNQLLVCDLEPAITGAGAIGDLRATLQAVDGGGAAAEALASAERVLEAIDGAGLGQGTERYRAVAELLLPLPADLDPAHLFQVDLFKPAREATLGGAPLQELVRAIALLKRVQPRSDNPALALFRSAFKRRYEGRWVSLFEALDEELGLGFGSAAPGSDPSPLLDGLEFRGQPTRRELDARACVCLRRVADLLRVGAREWALTEADLGELTPQYEVARPLPDAFAVMASLAAAGPDALTRGEFKVLVAGTTGPSGARLLGRFCHLDNTLCAAVEAHLRAEEALDEQALFAEVVHLPDGRVGNILCRPVLRGYEVTYLGRSGAPPAQQVPISDIEVTVVGEHVLLRSRRLGRRLSVRLTNAHNHQSAELGVYRFLCALQEAPVQGVGWSWGVLGAALPFLPRVTSGRVVLALATWNLDERDLAPLRGKNPSASYRALVALRERLGLPRHVLLHDGHRQLPVDLEQALSVESLLSLLERRSVAQLVEPFPAGDELVAAGPEGAFVHDLIVPFVRAAPPVRAPAAVGPSPAITRSFTPGSEWLYFKLYTGTITADALLTDVVAPFVGAHVGNGSAHRWFFVRYEDPEFHLRVRLLVDPVCAGAIIRGFHEATAEARADGRLWRLAVDTYEREVERYGGSAGIELAERLFEADSDAVITILSDVEPQQRWKLALRGAHDLLVDLELDLAARLSLARSMREDFGRELRAGPTLNRQLAAKFRCERAGLAELLAAPAKDGELGLQALAERSARLVPIAQALRACALTGPITGLARSFVHMHINRMLRSDAQAQEFVLYDFLARLYLSERARRPRRP